MNAKKNYSMALPVGIVLMLLLAAPLMVLGQPQSYKMTGKISAVNSNYQTIVIEVPLGSQMFTVAGPLASDARLTKNNQAAMLKDFKVGETVTVIFHSTDKGHVIDRLMG